MVTFAQRLESLRNEKGLTRPALSAALGMPRNAAEKFETGRQTPTKEQQQKIAAYFEVSIAYLRGESDDPTSMASWMTAALSGEDPGPEKPVRRAAAAPKPQPASGETGSVLAALLRNKAFHDTLRAEILDVLRSGEGQDILSRIVKKELDKQK